MNSWLTFQRNKFIAVLTFLNHVFNCKMNHNSKTRVEMKDTDKNTSLLNQKIYFESKNKQLTVINADFLTTTLLPSNSVDLIITSPPYNVDIRYGSYKDDITYDNYLAFTERWLRRAFHVLKHDGRMCLNLPLDKSKGRKEEGFQSIYADVLSLAKKVGWKYFSTIIWNESNISRRTAWGSWLSARAPYVIAPVETIILLYKTSWKKTRKGASDIQRDEFIEWTNGMWTFSGEKRTKIGHPAPFPLELPKRCIKLFSFIDDVILDPFLGSGTTLIACARLNRKGIGIEIDETYCKLATERIIREGMIHQKKLTDSL